MKLRETLICLLFLRPAVDAYRVSTNHDDSTHTVSNLNILTVNKTLELSTESIPACILQLCVWLTNKEEAGTYALASIAISALTTGYASAIIAFDMDVDVSHRKHQPRFYGFIPDGT